MSQTAMIEPAEEDLQPDTRSLGSTGEKARAATPSSDLSSLLVKWVLPPTCPLCGLGFEEGGRENDAVASI